MELTREQLVCSKEQSLELIKYGAHKKTILEWVEHVDTYGSFNSLDENTGIGIPAYTIGELAAIAGLTFGAYDVRLLADKVLEKLKQKQGDYIKVYP